MEANQKIREIIKKSGKTQKQLADELGISKRTLDTKLYRGGFYTEELIQIAKCLGFHLAFVNDEEKIIFDIPDLKAVAN